nr:hypothetical transcript [Hymenolepis microstoma]
MFLQGAYFIQLQKLVESTIYPVWEVSKVTFTMKYDLLHELRNMFERSAKVFPLQRFTGWRPDADTMRHFYGAMEIVCGVVMMVGCENAADMANIVLTILLFFSLYASWALGEGLKEASHAIVLGLVLACRFVIRLQTLQGNESQGEGESVDPTSIDLVFQKELRCKIASLRDSVRQTQEALDSTKGTEGECEKVDEKNKGLNEKQSSSVYKRVKASGIDNVIFHLKKQIIWGSGSDVPICPVPRGPFLRETLQGNESQGEGESVDPTSIDLVFQKELRCKIASLRDSVRQTQEALDSTKGTEGECEKVDEKNKGLNEKQSSSVYKRVKASGIDNVIFHLKKQIIWGSGSDVPICPVPRGPFLREVDHCDICMRLQ